jgi:hypothetical protein
VVDGGHAARGEDPARVDEARELGRRRAVERRRQLVAMNPSAGGALPDRVPSDGCGADGDGRTGRLVLEGEWVMHEYRLVGDGEDGRGGPGGCIVRERGQKGPAACGVDLTTGNV